jgi:hypothetical protein
MAAARHDIEWEVAHEGLQMIYDAGWRTYREPTGNYASHLTVTRESVGTLIHDNDIIYGSWLEGTSSRNRTTRFKGYWLWRKMREELEERSGLIADPVVRKYVRVMR